LEYKQTRFQQTLYVTARILFPGELSSFVSSDGFAQAPIGLERSVLRVSDASRPQAGS